MSIILGRANAASPIRQSPFTRAWALFRQALANAARAAREQHDERVRVAAGAFLLTKSDPWWFAQVESSELTSNGNEWPPDILGILVPKSQGIRNLLAELSVQPNSEIIQAANGFCPVGSRHQYHQQIALNAQWQRVIENHHATYMR